MDLKAFAYNGQTINQREDGYINLTQMCQANGKKLENFMKTTKTQEYVVALSNSMQIEVVDSKQGQNGGTWGHPSLAINLARWISANFAVWCDAHIFNLMSNGQTSLIENQVLKTPQNYIEALRALLASEEEKELLKLEKQQLEQDNTVLATAVDELFNYSSILRVAKFNDVSETEFQWRRLKAVSQKLGLEVKKVPSPRYEYQNLYSHDAWRVAYPDVDLPETTTLKVYRN